MSALITSSVSDLKYLLSAFRRAWRKNTMMKPHSLDLTTKRREINVYFILLMNF